MKDEVKVLLIILGFIVSAIGLYFIALWLFDYVLWAFVGLYVIGAAIGFWR